MLPLRLLPRVATKSLRKRGLEMTNHAVVLNVKDRRKQMLRMKDDNALLRDTIGESTFLKYLPQDKRLDLNKCNNNKYTDMAGKDDDIVRDLDMLHTDNDNDVVTISDKNEQTIELLDAHDCTERHEISDFCHIVDVPGDGNCGFYAIMTLLVKRNMITDELTVTDLSQKIND